MRFLSNFVNGLGLGSVYAIIALGYTMVYGIAKMLNFAHGDVIMVGAYVAFFALTRFHVPLIPGILAAVICCTVLGVVIERLAYKPLRQASSLSVLITAIGVSYFLQNSAQLLWSASPKMFPSIISTGALEFGGLSISYLTLITIATCLVVMVCLTLFINKTKTGSAMRACSEDKGAATLMGINVNICPFVCQLSHCHSHTGFHARYQGLHCRRLRRNRLDPRSTAGRASAGNH